jgi:hypothetical protein
MTVSLNATNYAAYRHVSNIGKDSVLKSVADFAYDAYRKLLHHSRPV